MLISFSSRTKQIFFFVIKLEPGLLPWLQLRKNNRVPTELDVSISAIVHEKSPSQNEFITLPYITQFHSAQAGSHIT